MSAFVLLALGGASAQVSSHSPTALKAAAEVKQNANPPAAPAIVPTFKPGAVSTMGSGAAGRQPVVRVNGAVLTETDLLLEMYAIFPYARQHNGFPKSMEGQIRQGALQMIIFEELLYQDAKRRNLAIAPARLARAEAAFRKQFPNEASFRQYLVAEHNGSQAVWREKIRRSLLIERMLKTEVTAKSKVTLADAKAFYDNNPKRFSHGETFHLQTISIVPPQGADAEVHKEARKRADDAIRQAKATKNYQEFGLLAEKISDDDWHVNMGDRKAVDAAKLPPPVIKAARAMKPGQVSDLIQLGSNYTLFRLVAHTPAGKTPFAEVKTKLLSDLQKERTEQVRSKLAARLRKGASIDVL